MKTKGKTELLLKLCIHLRFTSVESDKTREGFSSVVSVEGNQRERRDKRWSVWTRDPDKRTRLTLTERKTRPSLRCCNLKKFSFVRFVLSLTSLCFNICNTSLFISNLSYRSERTKYTRFRKENRYPSITVRSGPMGLGINLRLVQKPSEIGMLSV